MKPKSKVKSKKEAKDSIEVYDISKFTILVDLALIKPLRSGTGSDLIDPEQYDDKPEFGEVLNTGSDVTTVQKGDIVFFGKYSSLHVRSNGKDYYLIREEDIMAKQ